MTAMTQFDLFGEHQAARDGASTREKQAAARAARYTVFREALKIDCCSGEPIPLDEHGCEQYRCGRCGALTYVGTFAFNHDCGWAGCYADTEPTRGMDQTIREIGLSAHRHDNQHHPHCARPGCGHARGVHQGAPSPSVPEDSSCYEYCGCRGYLAPATPTA
ncbi:hypothetical protein [Streptomyces sp. NPDC057909]|uniref:hypothetical protein n=1 Tax=Streptomyces sp. NPDC057909 TaxID=3346277 RepID=UPI0036EF30A7